MTRHRTSDPIGGVSRWLAVIGSLAIAFHLMAVLSGALAAPSGPWPNAEGGGMSTPPQFAFTVHDDLTSGYLRLIKMTHDYHFLTNRPALPGVSFEARLKDASGEERATLRFPDPDANACVRHRQSLLARWLADDQPVPPPVGEVIAAPNQDVPKVTIWDITEPRRLAIRAVPEHLVPRDRSVFRPSEWSLLLARSYARHLSRTHEAATVEIIRHTREAIPPAVLFFDNMKDEAFAELLSNFGELPR
jgi:hypothetical protein